MSYILGALKKAEKERKQDKAPGFDNWDQQEWAKPSQSTTSGNLVLYATLSTLMLVMIIFAWLAYKVLITPDQTAVSTSETAGKTEPVRMEVIDASSEEVVPVYVEPVDTEVPITAPLVTRTTQTPPVVKAPIKEAPVKDVRATNKISSPQNTRTNRSYALPVFSGHIYFSNNHRLSRVFSESKSYREGDEVNGYLVESISETQVLLSRGGKNFWVKLDN